VRASASTRSGTAAIAPSGQEAAALPVVDIPVVGKALQLIEKNYVDPSTLDPRKILQDVSRGLEGSISPFMAQVEEERLNLRFRGESGQIPLPSPLTIEDLPIVLRQTLGFLDKTYRGRLDSKEREHLAVDGMVAGLDPHSNFLLPSVYKEFKIGTKGNFGGIGIVIGIRDGNLSVITSLEETPAWGAGLKAKDRIIQINDEATINMSLTEAVEKLRGPIASRVKVTIQREGVPVSRTYEMTRALIHIQSVGGRLLDPPGRIGLIRIKNFQEDRRFT